ncbi:conserved hypothetical protein [Flavobacterium psychrophilum]|uniref:hypothetical protein n=1 Tax=Flavobacterium psychrophilum TaxID=96345 RepID=UPI00073EAE50|nr:hypothetical protein [Flavobacterium psychrophilum]EKT4520120.1 hypothetical protein [Flavobacterium psychrophilum]ELY2009082.1 hypothetical protein [Flavobacterium psychrophilum]SNB31204.1 conserved hypothetical protein [Flavobacterium psychrophilum]SNB96182.1 conserved hypothetical protein [Flavobacterium psychrophilum]GAQ49987.1 hypothetical protein FPK15_contig00081-0001 [Flavobacterium psychrophilum]
MEIFLSIIVGFVLGYFTSYANEKGKNKAVIEDTQQITEEREKVTSKYNLDSTKRKIQYETKSNSYMKYFNLLDELSQNGNLEAQEEFLPILAKFNSDYIPNAENVEKASKAAADFSNSMQKIMFKSQDKYLKFKNETNALKLIAGEDVLKLMNEIDEICQLSFNVSSQMMEDLAESIIEKKLSKLDLQKNNLENLATKTIVLREELTKEIRKELSEI